jgi:hypothetical protein
MSTEQLFFNGIDGETGDYLLPIKYGAVVDDRGLVQNWTANNDARSYAIVGDPAVRLMVGENGQERPTIGAINLPSPVPSPLPSEETAVQKSQKQLTQALEQF